jgi:hypothetical protein
MALLDDLYAASRARKVELDFFVYSAVFSALTASGDTTVNVAIDSDSDFVVRYVNLIDHSAAGTEVSDPDLLMQLIDQGSGRTLQNTPVHVQNICGTGQRPGILPEPKLIKGGSILQVTLTNREATTPRVDVAFEGFKVFYYQGFSREMIGIY